MYLLLFERLSERMRTIRWVDIEGNEHCIECYERENGAFICKKFVNGVEETYSH
jgi:hypothetical protein